MATQSAIMYVWQEGSWSSKQNHANC